MERITPDLARESIASRAGWRWHDALACDATRNWHVWVVGPEQVDRSAHRRALQRQSVNCRTAVTQPVWPGHSSALHHGQFGLQLPVCDRERSGASAWRRSDSCGRWVGRSRASLERCWRQADCEPEDHEAGRADHSCRVRPAASTPHEARRPASALEPAEAEALDPIPLSAV